MPGARFCFSFGRFLSLNDKNDKSVSILFLIYWLISVISRFISSVTLFLGCVHASKVLHKVLLVRILRCPATYFDVTPVGRLLNRFGKDVDIIDEALPITISSLILTFFSVTFYTFSYVLITAIIVSVLSVQLKWCLI